MAISIYISGIYVIIPVRTGRAGPIFRKHKLFATQVGHCCRQKTERTTTDYYNKIAVLHVHQERTDNLADDDLIQEFVAGVGIRELTFGTN